MDVLLDRGCNSWSTNKGGESALDLACRFGHVHVRILSTFIKLRVTNNSYLSAFLKSGCVKIDQKKTGGSRFDPFTALFCSQYTWKHSFSNENPYPQKDNHDSMTLSMCAC